MDYFCRKRVRWVWVALIALCLWSVPVADAAVCFYETNADSDIARVFARDDELFSIASWGERCSELRAQVVANRLLNLLDFGDIDSLELSFAGPNPVIRSNLGVLITVDENSVKAEGAPDVYELAKLWFARLCQSLDVRKVEDVTTAAFDSQSFEGIASWYGPGFDGRKTASGERYDMQMLTAAHRSLPFGTRLLVREPVSGRSVVVTVNDRGPFVGNRVLDLSLGAAQALDIVERGIAPVVAVVLPQ